MIKSVPLMRTTLDQFGHSTQDTLPVAQELQPHGFPGQVVRNCVIHD